MKFLRDSIENVKPNFVGEGKYAKWFPLFDAIENFVFNTRKPVSYTHLRAHETDS